MTATAEQEVQREWFPDAEAQTVSGLGRTPLWKLVRSGEVRAAKVGKAVRINRRSLDGYMDKKACANGEE